MYRPNSALAGSDLRPLWWQRVTTRVFNQTSSVYQTPVERHWLDTNLVTRKFKEHFRIIEGMGEFNTKCPADIFSLTAVYMPAIVSDVNAHYKQMRLLKKKATTTYPNYPKGTRTRLQLYRDYENCSCTGTTRTSRRP